VVTAGPKNDGGSVNNTISKFQNNADIQPITKTQKSVLGAKQPSYNMANKRVKQTIRMSGLEDRRILNRGIVSTGSMTTKPSATKLKKLASLVERIKG
jgi:hypothetical protein